MHRIALTEDGKALAIVREEVNIDQLEMYPTGQCNPGLDLAWTVADDLLILLNGPTTIVADTPAYKDQQEAILAAMAKFHPPALIAEGFRALCRQGLVDCVYNAYTAIEEAVEVFDAMSNPVRLQILKRCLESGTTASKLSELTGRRVPSIYHHISRLQNVGLLYSIGHGEGYATDGEMAASILRTLIDFFFEEVTDDNETVAD